MSFRKNVKKNIPRVDPQSYIFLTAGNYKSGKTRWWKELIEYFYPNDPDAGLLIAWEPGYKSWKLNSFIDLTEYKKEDEVKNGKLKVKSELELDADRWQYFKKEVVTGLIQESKEGRTSKVIGFDTVDRMIDCASAQVIVDANQKYPGNGFTSIQELSEAKKVYKENVWNNLYDELKRPVDTLRAAGYGLVFLAWTKEKTTELADGVKYNSIELMMNATCRKVFQSQADLICCLHNEVTALDKEGNELKKNLENKNGKEIATKFHESQTYMYFRESNYISIAGGRFKVLPEKEPYGIDTYVRVFTEAVAGQLDEGDSIEDLRKAEIEMREEKAQQFSETHLKEAEAQEEQDNEKTAADYHQELKDALSGLNEETKKNIVTPKMKEILGTANFLKSEDVEKLNEALEFVKGLSK